MSVQTLQSPAGASLGPEGPTCSQVLRPQVRREALTTAWEEGRSTLERHVWECSCAHAHAVSTRGQHTWSAHAVSTCGQHTRSAHAVSTRGQHTRSQQAELGCWVRRWPALEGPPDSGSSAHPADTPRGSPRLTHLQLVAEELRPRQAGRSRCRRDLPATHLPCGQAGAEATLLTSGSAERGWDGPASPCLLPERVRRTGDGGQPDASAALRGHGRGQRPLAAPGRASLLQPAPWPGALRHARMATRQGPGGGRP